MIGSGKNLDLIENQLGVGVKHLNGAQISFDAKGVEHGRTDNDPSPGQHESEFQG